MPTDHIDSVEESCAGGQTQDGLSWEEDSSSSSDENSSRSDVSSSAASSSSPSGSDSSSDSSSDEDDDDTSEDAATSEDDSDGSDASDDAAEATEDNMPATTSKLLDLLIQEELGDSASGIPPGMIGHPSFAIVSDEDEDEDDEEDNIPLPTWETEIPDDDDYFCDDEDLLIGPDGDGDDYDEEEDSLDFGQGSQEFDFTDLGQPEEEPNLPPPAPQQSQLAPTIDPSPVSRPGGVPTKRRKKALPMIPDQKPQAFTDEEGEEEDEEEEEEEDLEPSLPRRNPSPTPLQAITETENGAAAASMQSELHSAEIADSPPLPPVPAVVPAATPLRPSSSPQLQQRRRRRAFGSPAARRVGLGGPQGTPVNHVNHPQQQQRHLQGLQRKPSMRRSKSISTSILQQNVIPGSLLEGFLEKQGSIPRRSGWRTRFFVLMPDKPLPRLYYFKSLAAATPEDPSKRKPSGQILLPEHCGLHVMPGEVFGKEFVLSITPEEGKRRFLLSCSSEYDRQYWLRVLRECRGSVRKDPPKILGTSEKEGFLMKQGGIHQNKGWKLRFFALHRLKPRMSYYSSAEAAQKRPGKPQGVIHLNKNSQLRESSSANRSSVFAFSFHFFPSSVPDLYVLDVVCFGRWVPADRVHEPPPLPAGRAQSKPMAFSVSSKTADHRTYLLNADDPMSRERWLVTLKLRILELRGEKPPGGTPVEVREALLGMVGDYQTTIPGGHWDVEVKHGKKVAGRSAKIQAAGRAYKDAEAAVVGAAVLDSSLLFPHTSSKEGWLFQMGRTGFKGRGWRHRFVAVNSFRSELEFYTSLEKARRSKPSGVVKLGQQTAVKEEPQAVAGKGHVFSISVPDKQYHFAAATDEDRTAWVNALTALL